MVPLTGEVAFSLHLYVILRAAKANECQSPSMIWQMI